MVSPLPDYLLYAVHVKSADCTESFVRIYGFSALPPAHYMYVYSKYDGFYWILMLDSTV